MFDVVNTKKINVMIKSMLFSLLSVLVGIFVAVIFVMWSKEMDFLNSFKLLLNSLWVGGFGNIFSFSETIVYATIYIFTGLAHTVAFKTGLFNIGVEGQFTVGMLGAIIVGLIPGIPFLLHILLIFLSGILSGGLWALMPAYLKVKFNSNEVVTTIMMNFISLHLLNLFIGTLLNDPGYDSTYSILSSAMMPRIFSEVSTRANFGFFVGILVVILVHVLINKTKMGYELRSVGHNKYASEYGGINVKKSILISMVISGIIAGLGGAIFVSGVQHRIPKLNNFLNYGFDGIAVSLLARNNPVFIIISSILFGALNASSLELQFNGIPKDIVFLIQSVMIIFISGEYLFRYITCIFLKNESQKGENS